MAPRGVAFLDRDGVLNEKPAEGSYVTRPEELRIIPGAPEAILALNRAGWRVVVVTNQRGIALGEMTERDLERIHERLRALLAAKGAHLAGIFDCPHDGGRCTCRKPGTGLFEEAAQALGAVDFAASAVVGDARSDMEAAAAIGARRVLVGDVVSPETRAIAADLGVDLVAPSLAAAVRAPLLRDGPPGTPGPGVRLRVAYLCSKYPYVSHSFVLREVEALRRLGAAVDTFTVRPTPDAMLLSEADRREAVTTQSLLPARAGVLARAFLRALARNPRGLARALALTARLAPGGVRAGLWRLFYWGEAVALWSECEARGVRHIHAHFANNATDIAMLAAVIGGGRPRGWTWSFTMHGPTEFSDVQRHRLADKAARASLVVCISDFCRSQVMRLVDKDLWGRLEVVHCGVELDRFPVAARERRPGTVADVLVVARLAPDKGIELALAAIAEMRTAGTAARLTIVGDGPERDRLAARANALGVADLVEFRGAVGQDEIASIYADADVLCLPSFAEGLPVVLMEAMATGLPVVATRVMGIPEIVVDGENGILVNPGRADQLAAALTRLIADPAERVRMGRKGRSTVEREFDIDESARRLVASFLLCREGVPEPGP